MTFTIRELNEYRDRLWKELIPYCNGAPFLYGYSIENDLYYDYIDFLRDKEIYYCKTKLGFIRTILN